MCSLLLASLPSDGNEQAWHVQHNKQGSPQEEAFSALSVNQPHALHGSQGGSPSPVRLDTKWQLITLSFFRTAASVSHSATSWKACKSQQGGIGLVTCMWREDRNRSSVTRECVFADRSHPHRLSQVQTWSSSPMQSGLALCKHLLHKMRG